ncbi:hypothetical protein Tco_1079453 [Tanacetum coccineum]|uniref:Uncharacterized protein n=1 Tax=Tanacetum coccineum TaxID=301880 RepID=A0ABQ5HTX2_9ASTR
MLWEWRGIANMDFIQLGGSSRVDEMILARVRSGFAGEKRFASAPFLRHADSTRLSHKSGIVASFSGGYKRAHFRRHKRKAVKKTPGKTSSFPFPKPDENHPLGKDSSKKISNIIGKAANFANSAKTKKASPYVPIITNYTQLWWLPNVVVAHGNEGIEVLHLASGRKLCKYSLGEISSTMVWDLDKKQLLSSIPLASDCSLLALAASQVHRGQYAIGFVEGSVRLYDIQTPDEEKEALKALDTTMIRFRQTEASRMALPLNVRRDGECEVHVIESVIAEPELEQRKLDDCYVTLETSYTRADIFTMPNGYATVRLSQLFWHSGSVLLMVAVAESGKSHTHIHRTRVRKRKSTCIHKRPSFKTNTICRFQMNEAMKLLFDSNSNSKHSSMSMDEELAKKVFEEEQAKAMAEQEQERINFEVAVELQKQLDEREEVSAKPTQAQKIDWSDLYEDIRLYLEKGEKQSKESTKRQKLEDDIEKEDLKAYLDLVLREEFAMEIESLGTKYPIVDWKTHVLTENFMYYQIFRADGSSKNYKIFSEMLDDFDRHDVLNLHRLVEERYATSRPEGYDLML